MLPGGNLASHPRQELPETPRHLGKLGAGTEAPSVYGKSPSEFTQDLCLLQIALLGTSFVSGVVQYVTSIDLFHSHNTPQKQEQFDLHLPDEETEAGEAMELAHCCNAAQAAEPWRRISPPVQAPHHRANCLLVDKRCSENPKAAVSKK